MKQEEINAIIKYKNFRKRRLRAILYNIGQDLKWCSLFVIGIPLATIIYLAQLKVIDLITINPLLTAFTNIALIFLYGCLIHDLMIPYLKVKYIKVPKE